MTEPFFHSASDALTFITAGNATVTVESLKTQKHLTFKVSQMKNSYNGKPIADKFFVSLLNGPDNMSSYMYLGVLNGDEGLKLTAKSKAQDDAPSVRGFRYVWANLVAGKLPSDAHVFHDGKCGRCGRKLTVPESLHNGIGPECIKKVGL